MRINWGHPLTRSLVFDVPLSERGGSIASDLAEDRNMTITGNPPWANGPLGIGLDLDGSTQYASVAAAVSTKTTDYSIEVWFKLNTVQAAGEKVVFYLGSDAAANGVAIEIDAGKLEVLFRGQNLFDTGKVLTTAGINHVVLSNVAGPITSVYLNGVITGATSNSATNAPTANTSIGRDDSGLKFADITVYLARVWERGLNKSEVVQLYTDPWQIYQMPVAPVLLYEPVVVPPGAITYTTWKSLTGAGNI